MEKDTRTTARLDVASPVARNPESDLKLLSNFVRATSVVKSTPCRPSLVYRAAVYRRAPRTHGIFKETLSKVVPRALLFAASRPVAPCLPGRNKRRVPPSFQLPAYGGADANYARAAYLIFRTINVTFVYNRARGKQFSVSSLVIERKHSRVKRRGRSRAGGRGGGRERR